MPKLVSLSIKLLNSRVGRVISILVLASWFTACQVVTNRLIKPDRRQLHASYQAIMDHAADLGLEIEHAAVPAADGSKLSVLIVHRAAKAVAPPAEDAAFREALPAGLRNPAPGSQGTVFMLHGFRSRKEQWLPVARQLAWSGFTCILADSRAHGESDGTYATFGYKEAPDVKTVWEWVKQHVELPNPALSLIGYSMGGAIALKALDDVPEIQRVVTMSTFDKLERVMWDQAEPTFGRFTRPMVMGVCASAKLRTGMNPARISPADCAARHTVPLLVIHGADDNFVNPAAAAALVAAAKGPSEQILMPGKNHWSLFYDRDPKLHAKIAVFLAAPRHAN